MDDAILERPGTSRPEERVPTDDAILDRPGTSRPEKDVKLNNVVLERPKKRRSDVAVLDRPKECTQFEI